MKKALPGTKPTPGFRPCARIRRQESVCAGQAFLRKMVFKTGRYAGSGVDGPVDDADTLFLKRSLTSRAL